MLLSKDGETTYAGDLCRDELLFPIIKALVRFEDDYTLREIVRGDAPLECPCEDVRGERVIVGGYEGGGAIGGPMRAEQSAAIIADVDRVGRAGVISTSPLRRARATARAARGLPSPSARDVGARGRGGVILVSADNRAVDDGSGFIEFELELAEDHGPVTLLRPVRESIVDRLPRTESLWEIAPWHSCLGAIETRYEKTACNYLALAQLACARLWLEN